MIPISTDAPIYHYPIATAAAIVLNLFCFWAFCLNADSDMVGLVTPDGRVIINEDQLMQEISRFKTEREAKEFVESLSVRGGSWMNSLSVEFGTFKPWQWVTNNFMHDGWQHLLGNMVFLWAFGLIVEGKVGALWFSLIYLGIGAVYGCIIQVLSLITGWEGIALGASAAIFGLLALCVAWAPANEFTLLFRFNTFDISILLYGGLFFAKEVAIWAMTGFEMSSQLLHIVGFAVAMPLGLWMVQAGLVDCEGWDLFSFMTGNTGEQSTVGKEKAQARQAVLDEKQRAQDQQLLADEAARRVESTRRMHDQVSQALDEGQVEVAIKLQNRLMAEDSATNWKQTDLYRVVQALLRNEDYDQALPMMEKHIDMFEQSRFSMQMAMVRIWLNQHQPQKALAYLDGFNPSFLSSEEAQQIEQLAKFAREQIAASDAI